MAKRKGSGNPLPLIILVGAVVVCFVAGAAALLIPVAILVFAIKSGIDFTREKNATSARINVPVRLSHLTPNDFWLTPPEKNQFTSVRNELIKAIRTIEAADSEADQRGLSRNKDGSISRRSKMGKKLQGLIESSEDRKTEYADRFAELRSLPRRRYDRLVSGFKRAMACTIGVVGFTISAYASSIEQFGEISTGVRNLVKFPVDLASNVSKGFLGSSEGNPEYIDVSSAASVLFTSYTTLAISIVAGWVLATLVISGAKRPALVEANNIDDFDTSYSRTLGEKQSKAHTGSVPDTELAASGRNAAKGVQGAASDAARLDPVGSPNSESHQAEAGGTKSTANYQTLASVSETESSASADMKVQRDEGTSHVLGDSRRTQLAWSRKAIWSAVFGFLSIFVVPALPAIVLGHIAVRKDRGEKRGIVLARLGLSLGWLFLVLFALTLVFGEN